MHHLTSDSPTTAHIHPAWFFAHRSLKTSALLLPSRRLAHGRGPLRQRPGVSQAAAGVPQAAQDPGGAAQGDGVAEEQGEHDKVRAERLPETGGGLSAEGRQGGRRVSKHPGELLHGEDDLQESGE